jgi:hypothetical protein
MRSTAIDVGKAERAYLTVAQDQQSGARRHPTEPGNHRNGAAIFRHACWMDLEGIVSKRIGSDPFEQITEVTAVCSFGSLGEHWLTDPDAGQTFLQGLPQVQSDLLGLACPPGREPLFGCYGRLNIS